jgi:FtsH-binding integral membrane protein
MNAYSGVSPAATTALSRDQARAVFGQVMGLVALTLGCLALGAYIGRDLSGGIGILFFVAGFACVFGLNLASARGNEQLAITLLFGLGLLLGLALGPVLSS